MKLAELEIQAETAEGLLKAMASRPRLMILCELQRGEQTVTGLNRAIGSNLSALSQHLARLRAARLVATRRESQTIYYSLASEAVSKILDALYRVYCAAPEAASLTEEP